MAAEQTQLAAPSLPVTRQERPVGPGKQPHCEDHSQGVPWAALLLQAQVQRASTEAVTFFFLFKKGNLGVLGPIFQGL